MRRCLAEPKSSSPRLLALADALISVEKMTAHGDDGACAVQVREQSIPHLAVRRQLAKVHAPDPAGGDIADQERPPGKTPLRKQRDQLVGGAGGALRTSGSGVICAVGDRVLRLFVCLCLPPALARSVEDGVPPAPFGRGKFQVIVRADIHAGWACHFPGFLQLDKIPSRIVLPADFRALEAPRPIVLTLYDGDVQEDPPPSVPAASRGAHDQVDGMRPKRAPSCWVNAPNADRIDRTGVAGETGASCTACGAKIEETT